MRAGVSALGAVGMLALALVLACGPQPQPQPPPQPQPEEASARRKVEPDAHLFDRVAVLGASVSAGFASPRVAVELRAAIDQDRKVVMLDRADVWMFRDVWTRGAEQVDASVAFKPTVTIALDFLFWYVYRPTDPDERLASLERGLRELGRVEGPLAVGDLPDMKGASEAMLSKAAVPGADELARMNARVQAWAAERAERDVTAVLPLGAWSARLAAGERVDVGDGLVVDAEALMFVDGLHVNALGLWWMLREVDQVMEREMGAVEAEVRFMRPGS